MTTNRQAVRANLPVETVGYLSSVIPDNRLRHLVHVCGETLRRVPGNLLEVGVYKGGTLVAIAREAARIDPDLTVWGIDTFAGHPYSDGHPVHPKGKYGDVDAAELQRALTAAGCMNVELRQQFVETGLPDCVRDLSFVHVDCDLYRPVLYCALSVPSRMKPGGVIYFDDFGHDHCPGATNAVMEALYADTDSPLFGHARHDVYLPEDNTMWSCYVQVGGMTR